jgi:hypothetical protein
MLRIKAAFLGKDPAADRGTKALKEIRHFGA